MVALIEALFSASIDKSPVVVIVLKSASAVAEFCTILVAMMPLTARLVAGFDLSSPPRVLVCETTVLSLEASIVALSSAEIVALLAVIFAVCT